MSERIIVFSTVGKAEDAERIARALVERRLAACVNVIQGVVSVYRWKGSVERGEERLLVIKTRAERLDALREALVSLHPYELPELVAVPIEGGHQPYLSWLDDCVASVPGGAAPHPLALAEEPGPDPPLRSPPCGGSPE